MNLRQSLYTVFQGFCIGFANLTPVSGSTIALILGVYQDLIDLIYSVSQVGKNLVLACVGRVSFVQVGNDFRGIPWKFASLLFLGLAGSIVLLAGALDWILVTYPQQMFGFFFGLVILSMSVPWKEIQKPHLYHVLIMMLTVIVSTLLLSEVPPRILEEAALWYVFLGGAVAISAMILPGLSGSYILIIMGLYNYVIGLLKDVTSGEFGGLLPLIIFILGIIIGLLVFVRYLKKVLVHYPGTLMAVLTGLIVASIPTVWPFFRIVEEQRQYVSIQSFSLQEVIGIISMLVVGMGTVILLNSLARQQISIR